MSPTFRSYATKKNKEELELLQARQKVREMRGSSAVAHDDDAADALPQKPSPKPAAKRKGGKGGGGGQPDG